MYAHTSELLAARRGLSHGSLWSSHHQVHSVLLAVPNPSESVCKPSTGEKGRLQRTWIPPFTTVSSRVLWVFLGCLRPAFGASQGRKMMAKV